MSGAVPYPAGGHRHDFTGAMSAQLEVFEGTDPLIGIEVNLPCQCQSGHDLLLIGCFSLRRLNNSDSLEFAWHELSDPRRGPKPRMTIEAVLWPVIGKVREL
jgi:hypothetical protein